jgi:Putative adhesin
MKTYPRILIAAFAALLIATFTAAGEDGNRSKSFSVRKGGTMEVSTSKGDIRISPWEKNEVSVVIEGLDDEDLEKVKMTQNGNIVRVSYRSRWNDGSGHVLFAISVPSQFNLDMNTSGGDLEVKGGLTGKIDGSTSGGDIKLGNIFGGPVEVTTSGGDIRTEKIEGDGSLKTAGGDIQVGSVNGSLSVNTSGGNIQVETITKSLDAKTAGGNIIIGNVGGEAHVSTSGGDINVGKVSGKATLNTAGGDIELKGASGNVSAKTSGGDVKLQNITGSINAKTSGGEVEAELIPSGKGGSKLSSAGGDVRLYIDENSKATIEATIRLDGWGSRKSRYIVKSEFPKESYETDEEADEIRAVYKLNGGGELIELSTSNSNIEIHKLRH